MRAREPDVAGHIERDGVRIHYEVFGDGPDTILFLPTWSVLHSRVWKAQVPYFARHDRVITFDGRGNGGSSRPVDAACYSEDDFAADALAVLDATATSSALLASLSMGAIRSLLLAAVHPERVRGLAFIAPSLALAPLGPERAVSFTEELASDEGWAKFNAHYWRRDYRGFLEFFFSRMFTEPHSTKQIEDCVGWGLETDAETLIATVLVPKPDRERLLDLCARVRCPVLVLHGEEDAISPSTRGVALAGATNGTLVLLEGAGHGPHARDPVRVNLMLRDFAERCGPPAPSAGTWRRAARRRRRALLLSSPIGLGHAQRDLAIARELRSLVPDLEIDWLAQHPVTRVLEAEGERVHPASVHLASESRHIECESHGHDLHCFHALRRMDEILLANFMVFHDVVREQQYDVWIADEAWDVDYYLHENPELKRAAYVWLADFVGYLPVHDADERERFLVADYNAEMIEHIARFPRVRDRALFVGDADDIVPDRFGPELPLIRDWTETHFAFTGYIGGFDPVAFSDRSALRDELGWSADETVCLVSVGGSGVGADLLRKVMAAYPEARRRIQSLRMIVVAGPRIDTTTLPAVPGVEVLKYVHNLYRHLVACDIAVVQGGLTTTMELTAGRTPFLYFPLRHHFEQQFHVRHRLERYGAGRCMDYHATSPHDIADAIASELAKDVAFRPVEAGGARRAAALIADML
jgi:pimeloyl-ACP methyl ester carboxylesterase/predicted glycosyltransferase